MFFFLFFKWICFILYIYITQQHKWLFLKSTEKLLSCFSISQMNYYNTCSYISGFCFLCLEICNQSYFKSLGHFLKFIWQIGFKNAIIKEERSTCCCFYWSLFIRKQQNNLNHSEFRLITFLSVLNGKQASHVALVANIWNSFDNIMSWIFFFIYFSSISYLSLSFNEGMSSLLAYKSTDRLVRCQFVGCIGNLFLEFKLQLKLFTSIFHLEYNIGILQ